MSDRELSRADRGETGLGILDVKAVREGQAAKKLRDYGKRLGWQEEGKGIGVK
jgi:hypothetical protein